MASEEAKTLSNELQDFIQQTGPLGPEITNQHLIDMFALLKKVMHKILESRGATIEGQPSLKQYFDVIDQLISLSDEQKQNIEGFLVGPETAIRGDPNMDIQEEERQSILLIADSVNRLLWGKCISENQWKKQDDQLHLWIGEVTEALTEDDFREYFGTFGEVQHVTVKHASNAAYVDITKSATTDSILSMDHEIKGVKLNVDKNWTKGRGRRRRWGRWNNWSRGGWGGYGAGEYTQKFEPYEQ